MTESAKALRLLGFLLSLSVFGCEALDTAQSNSKDDQATRFCTVNNLSRSLLKQMDLAADLQNSNSIQYPFCIYTEDISRNVNTENDVQSWSTIAMNTWLEPLIGEPGWKVRQAEAYRVQPGNSGCPDKDNGLSVYKIRINDLDGANNSYPGFQMNMGNWGVHKLVVLHEMGHAIGLGDTYSWDGHKPIGQPTATMKSQWNLNGVLQQDDKDAIRFIWARMRGEDNPCPDGYVIGGVEGENWSGEVYCVLGDGGGDGDGDGCQDNDYYADAQGYSCSDWVGYDCSAAEIYGYSQSEENEIISNCKKSCELCSDNDACPTDPKKTEPGICGCGTPDTDSDKDGTADCNDNCPSDAQKTQPGQCGCGRAEGSCGGDCEDDPDYIDPQGYACVDWVGYDCTAAEIYGYSQSEEDEIKSSCRKSCALCDVDNCPSDPNKTEPGICGCGMPDIDSDGDGTANCKDNCPHDPEKTQPGQCGCGKPDADSDGDGTADCKDNCPNDPQKTEPGECGCGKEEGSCGGECKDDPDFIDAQGYTCADWVGYDCTNAENWGYSNAEEAEIKTNCPKSCELCDAVDECPSDPNKTEPGICGCGKPDTDSDGDGTANCKDNCPNDPQKISPGDCGCGKEEGSCGGECEDDPNFIDAQGYACADWVGYDCTNAGNYGYSSAEEAEIKSNCKKSCELCDAVDECPGDPNKTEPGECGCGVPEGSCDGSNNIGGYNVYFGMLHSHTGVSDGTGTPDQAYRYARDTAKLDFFSVADHDYYPNDMSSNDWSKIKSAANSYNSDGNFVAFWGFEWTSDGTQDQQNGLAQGHISIIGSDDYCISTYEPTRTLNQLMTWLSKRDAIAFFNHPGQYGTSFNNYDFNYSDKVVGMELWNRSTEYYSSGHYDKALKKGWYIGAGGSQDNHSADWGTMNQWRMAVLANQKTRTAILAAMRARRFYSSRDKNLALSFKCNNAEMGSIISSGSLNCKIQAADGDNEKFSRIELLKNGSVIQTWNPNSQKPSVERTVTGSDGDYFYVRVYQSNQWDAISSPIFVED